MGKTRKDTKGRALRKGETYSRDKKRYRFSYTDQMGKRRSIYAKDLPELREKEKIIEQSRLDGLDLYALSMSDLNYVFDRYIATKTELQSTTKSNYIYTFDRYVRKGFGKKKISSIRYSDVLMFYISLMDRGLNINTLGSVHTVLRPAFQLAVRDNIIKTNPCDGVMAELKKKRGKPERRHALTLEEERAFFGELENPQYIRWKPLFMVMFGTGCRIGEIIGLRWADIDFENNMIVIDHNVTYYPRVENSFKCEFRIGKPKTAAGVRTIPMLEQVRDALLQEKTLQEESNYHCIYELDGMRGFIFSNRFGTLHNPSAINHQIKRIVNDHNAREVVKAKQEKRKPIIIPNFSCHIARHTFCSRLCENETNIKVIQSVMGHKDIQTTLDIYAEVSDQKKKEAFKSLNGNSVL